MANIGQGAASRKAMHRNAFPFVVARGHAAPSNAPSADSRVGQAMIEFVIGMVVVMVLVMALVQWVSLVKAHNRTLDDARREAGELALSDAATDIDILSTANFIRDWEEGPDQSRFTQDDIWTQGDVAGFDTRIVARSAENLVDLPLLSAAPEQRLGQLHGNPAPQAWFGLVHGEETETVPLLSAFQKLIYRAEGVDVRSEVWMTKAGGLY